MLRTSCPSPSCSSTVALKSLGSHLLLHSRFTCPNCQLEGDADEVAPLTRLVGKYFVQEGWGEVGMEWSKMSWKWRKPSKVALHMVIEGHSAMGLTSTELTFGPLLQRFQSKDLSYAANDKPPATHTHSQPETPKQKSLTSAKKLGEQKSLKSILKNIPSKPSGQSPAIESTDDDKDDRYPDEMEPSAMPEKAYQDSALSSAKTPLPSYSDVDERRVDLEKVMDRHKCYKCSTSLSNGSPSNLLGHILSRAHEFGSGSLSCGSCDDVFNSKEDFKAHNTQTHANAATFGLKIRPKELVAEIEASFVIESSKTIFHIRRHIADMQESDKENQSDDKSKLNNAMPQNQVAEQFSVNKMDLEAEEVETEVEVVSETEVEVESEVESEVGAEIAKKSLLCRTCQVDIPASMQKPAEMVKHVLSKKHGQLEVNFSCSSCRRNFTTKVACTRHCKSEHESASLRFLHPLNLLKSKLEEAFGGAGIHAFDLSYHTYQRLSEGPKIQEFADRSPSKSTNSESEEDEPSPLAQKTFVLEKNDKTSTVNVCSNNAVNKELNKISESGKSKIVQCSKCLKDVKYDKISILVDHVLGSNHPDFPNGQVECRMCNQTFNTVNGVQNHTRSSHPGQLSARLPDGLEKELWDAFPNLRHGHLLLFPRLVDRLTGSKTK